ncbi:MAG: hypothetical protein SNG35_05740 [Rikenellaceae bacterium]
MVRGISIKRFRQNLKRLSHRKGFGIHSPYVYRLVREVFAKRICDARVDGEVVHNLSQMGLKRRYVIELANFIYDSRNTSIVLCGGDRSIEHVDEVIEQNREDGAIIIIIDHASTLERELHFRAVVERHRSTSIDKKGYLILFNNHLPKQHFLL